MFVDCDPEAQTCYDDYWKTTMIVDCDPKTGNQTCYDYDYWNRTTPLPCNFSSPEGGMVFCGDDMSNPNSPEPPFSVPPFIAIPAIIAYMVIMMFCLERCNPRSSAPTASDGGGDSGGGGGCGGGGCGGD